MIFIALLSLLATVHAHSWIEQMTVIAPNGTFTGTPGYARGNVLRGPGFADALMVNLLPATGTNISDSDQMCKSSQTSQTQTSGSPRLQAAAGAAVALRFQENGHVTIPQTPPGKPPHSGKVFVYGTTQPKTNEQFNTIHPVWTADGSGGDKRGVLLSTQTFDDGRCYQVNGGAISQQRQKEFPHAASQLMGGDIWCQQDLALPADAPSGKPYTLYWVWDWSTQAGIDPAVPNGKAEIYTTCMDVDITSSSTNSKAAASFFVENQDLNFAAISAELANLGNPTAAADASNTSPAATSSSSSGFSSSSPAFSSSPAVSTTFSTRVASASTSQMALTSSAVAATVSTMPAASTSSLVILPIPPSGSTTQVAVTSTSQPFTTSTAPSMATSTNRVVPVSSSPAMAISSSSSSSSIITSAAAPAFTGTPQHTITQFDDFTQTVYETVSATGGSAHSPIEATANPTSTFKLRGRNALFIVADKPSAPTPAM